MSLYRLAALAVLTAVPTLALTHELSSLSAFDQEAAQRIKADPRYERLQQSDSQRGSGNVIYAGSDADCDFSDLQTAINNAADGDEIRLQNEAFAGDFVILGKSLTLIGGFESCTSTESTFKSTLDGDGNGGNTVLELFNGGNTSDSWAVDLENLNIINGNESSGLGRGGGLNVEGDFFVTLTDVSIQDNSSATAGGGVQITGEAGASLFIFGDTIIQNNNASGDGGGIACIGPQDQLSVIIDAGLVLDNSATRGGGIFADNCFVASHAGGVLQGIVGNEAATFGGGVAAVGASYFVLAGFSPGIFVNGDPDSAAVIANNSVTETDGLGGGMYLQGQDTLFESIDGRIAGNVSDRSAGVHVNFRTTFRMLRAEETDCREFIDGDSLARCSSLSQNSASRGAALNVAGTNSVAEISQTFITHNSASIDYSLASVRGGELSIENSIIAGNSGTSLLAQWDEGSLDISWSTITNNTTNSNDDSMIRINDLGSGTAPTSTTLHSSIIWNPGRDIYEVENPASNPADLNADCLVSHELTSLPGATDSRFADPLFRDPAGEDYRLTIQSPAIDFCDGSNTPPSVDFLQQPRGVTINTPSEPFDAGAYERLSSLLRDRFEAN